MEELGPEALVEMSSIADDIGHDVSWGNRMRLCAAVWEVDQERIRVLEELVAAERDLPLVIVPDYDDPRYTEKHARAAAARVAANMPLPTRVLPPCP